MSAGYAYLFNKFIQLSDLDLKTKLKRIDNKSRANRNKTKVINEILDKRNKARNLLLKD